jgi:hypothetical protein
MTSGDRMGDTNSLEDMVPFRGVSRKACVNGMERRRDGSFISFEMQLGLDINIKLAGFAS